jgi:hypothetical protein
MTPFSRELLDQMSFANLRPCEVCVPQDAENDSFEAMRVVHEQTEHLQSDGFDTLPHAQGTFISNDDSDAHDDNVAEYEYLAYTWFYRGSSNWEIPSEVPLGTADKDRIVAIAMPGTAKATPMLWPEGCDTPADFSYKTLRITVDKPLIFEVDGNTIVRSDLPDFVMPLWVDVIGDVFYGCIAEMGEGFVVLDLDFYDDFRALHGGLQRFSVTNDTHVWTQVPLESGRSLLIVADEAGVALALHQMNG